jgi:hypothetical protein
MNNIGDITRKNTGITRSKIEGPAHFDDLESIALTIVSKILQDWIESSEENLAKPQTRCRECGNFANFISKRVGFIQSQFGLLRYKRAYYVCPQCHQNTCPLDERLDPIGSLARLRAKLAEGNSLPVAEMARDWGLGTLRNTPLDDSFNLPGIDPGSNDGWTNFLREQIVANSGDDFANGLGI